MSVLEIKNLKKHFGKVRAVDGITFGVKKSEIFGFLGPNGAGKTTTINCMMDFLRPTSGEVKIFGHDSKDGSTKIKEQVGYLSADVRLYSGMTGLEHIKFLEKLRSKKSNARELAEKLDLNTKMRFKNLSTGNKQKLGLILALMFKPELLILDEPTAGLDPILQNEIYKILVDYAKNGTTIFMSSHNLSEVEKICDRVGIIKNGKLAAVEKISNLESKKIQHVTVRFAKKFAKSNLENKEVEIEEELPDGLILKVTGDINPLIQKLAKYKVKSLEVSHANLEEIFLQFYDGSK